MSDFEDHSPEGALEQVSRQLDPELPENFETENNLGELQEFLQDFAAQDALAASALEDAIQSVGNDPEFRARGASPELIREWIFEGSDQRSFVLEVLDGPFETRESVIAALEQLEHLDLSPSELARQPNGSFSEQRLHVEVVKLQKALKQFQEAVQGKSFMDDITRERMDELTSDLNRCLKGLRNGAYLQHIRYSPQRKHLDADDQRSRFRQFGLPEAIISKINQYNRKEGKKILPNFITSQEVRAYHEAGYLSEAYYPYLLQAWPLKKTQKFFATLSFEEQMQIDEQGHNPELADALLAKVPKAFALHVLKMNLQPNKHSWLEEDAAVKALFKKVKYNPILFLYKFRKKFTPKIPEQDFLDTIAHYKSLGLSFREFIFCFRKELSPEALEQEMATFPELKAREILQIPLKQIDLNEFNAWRSLYPEITVYKLHTLKTKGIDLKFAQKWRTLGMDSQVSLEIMGLKIDQTPTESFEQLQELKADGVDFSGMPQIFIKGWLNGYTSTEEIKILSAWPAPKPDFMTSYLRKILNDPNKKQALLNYCDFPGVEAYSFREIFQSYQEGVQQSTLIRALAFKRAYPEVFLPTLTPLEIIPPEEDAWLLKNGYTFFDGIRFMIGNEPAYIQEFFKLTKLGYSTDFSLWIMQSDLDGEEMQGYIPVLTDENREEIHKLHLLGISAEQLDNYSRFFPQLRSKDPDDIESAIDEIILSEYKRGELSEAAKATFAKHNLSFPSRYPNRILDGMINGYEAYDPPRRKALVLMTQSDWNTAFQNKKDPLNQLLQGYEPYIYEVSSDAEFFQAIESFGAELEENGEKIDLILMGGHGMRWMINWSSQKWPGPGNLGPRDRKELRQVERYFSDEAQAVLSSCSTRKGNRNIARMISRTLGGIQTFAPNQPTSLQKIRIDQQNRRVDEVIYRDEEANGSVETHTKKNTQ